MTSSAVHSESYSEGRVANAAVRHGMSLPFQPLSISFDDVKYFVDMPVVGHMVLLYVFRGY